MHCSSVICLLPLFPSFIFYHCSFIFSLICYGLSFLTSLFLLNIINGFAHMVCCKSVQVSLMVLFSFDFIGEFVDDLLKQCCIIRGSWIYQSNVFSFITAKASFSVLSSYINPTGNVKPL